MVGRTAAHYEPAQFERTRIETRCRLRSLLEIALMRLQRQPLRRLSLSLAANIILSCTLFPFAIPPFAGYSLSKLLEVLLWQSITTVGWPFTFPSLVFSLPFGIKLTNIVLLLFTLLYPVIQFLLIRSGVPTRNPPIYLWVRRVCFANLPYAGKI